jgi:isoquinoline 1-oxidoreductase subunit beta
MSTQEPNRSRWRITRRGFLIGAGIVGAAGTAGFAFGLPAAQLALANALDGAAPPANPPRDPLLWFAITPENRLRVASSKVEMGQGIHTALAQIAADELEMPWELVEVVQGSSAGPIPDAGGTSASNSVASLYTPLREAAASMREMLRAEAAIRLGVAAADLTVAGGAFSVTADPSRSLTYAAVVAGRTLWQVPEAIPPLKAADTFSAIGQRLPRVDLPGKIRGQAVYGYDVRVEGMRYGAVARPPQIGQRLLRAAPGTAAQLPGVQAVVIEDGFAGVVATSRLTALQALQQLDLEWSEVDPLQQGQIDALTTVQPGAGIVIQREGNAPGELRGAGVISAEYRTPMAAHANLEPQAAMVDVRPDKVIAAVSTQSPSLVAGDIARTLGRDAATVDVTPSYLGGGFGRKLNVEVAVEAARLSAAVGAPVHVGWTRTEEFRNGYVRPPTHHVLQARLTADGRIAAIEHHQASGDVLFPLFPAPLRALFGADFGAWRGARISYAVPHIRTVAQRVELPVPTGAWRGLGLLANVFAVESFIDELADVAGIDPLAFRLANLGDDDHGRRLRTALNTVAERAGWGTSVPQGRARGIACAVDANSVAAHVVEASITQENSIRVHTVWAAIDPGLPINPDGVEAQTIGNITMGLSATLIEELTVHDGRFAAGNFNDYPLLTMDVAPEIVVDVLRSGDVPYGLGEPPMGPIAAATANAVFALTGRRLRRLPLTLS